MASKNFSENEFFTTKKNILNETIQLIQNNPQGNITINDICNASGITKSTFYYYYHSIDDVINSTLSSINERIISSIPSVLLEKTCTNQILKTFTIMHECISEMGPGIISLRYTYLLKNKNLNDFPDNEPAYSFIISLLQKALETQELHSTKNAKELTESCFFLARGVCFTWCIQNGNFNLTEHCQKELSTYLKSFS